MSCLKSYFCGISSQAKPLGLKVIVTVHLVLLGVFNAIIQALNFSATFTTGFESKLKEFLSSSGIPAQDIAMLKFYFQAVCLVYLGIAGLFIYSALGLRNGRESSRKQTLTIVICLAALTVIFIVLQGPKAWHPAFMVPLLWFGWVVFYLTRKELDVYFKT